MKKCYTLPDKKIIAVDFDGTITDGDHRIWISKHRYHNDVMIPNMSLIHWILCHRQDYYFILWTNRYGKALKDAIQWCKTYGLVFDKVNANIVPFRTSRKIYADYYIDDKLVKEENLCQNLKISRIST